MSDPCITCGGDVGAPIPKLVEARVRRGMSPTVKRCPKCMMGSLMKFMASPDEDSEAPSKGQDHE